MEVMVKQEASELNLEGVIQSQAARIFGSPLLTLRSKMKKLGIKAATRGESVDQPLGNDPLP